MPAQDTITAQKTFNKPAEDVYRAWTEEAALKEWWKPAGKVLQSVQSDLQSGGDLRYTFESEDNSSLVITGKYEEVVPNAKLVYTWNWNLNNTPVQNGNYKLSIEFISSGQGSEIKVSQKSTDREEGIHPHQEGWEQALNDLEAYLSKD